MLTCGPADAMTRKGKMPNFGCTDSCCRPKEGWSASVSRSLEAPARLLSRRGSNSPSPTSIDASLRSSGPPRMGWRTPEKDMASLARSLPLAPELRGAKSASRAAPSVASSAALPPAPAAAPSVSVVDAACLLLERVVGECHDEVARPEHVFAPIFHSVSVPGISGGDYLRHHLLRLGLARKEHLSEAVVLHAFVLMDRLLHAQADHGAPARRAPRHTPLHTPPRGIDFPASSF